MIARFFAQNRRLVRCLAWLVATACLGLFLLSFDVGAAWQKLSHAKPGWIVVAVLANFAALPLLTAQWSQLLPATRPISWKILWDCATVSVAAMTVLPFGGGHAVAVGMIAVRGSAGLPGALSLMALEQLSDGFVKLALLLTALAVAPLSAALQHASWIFAAVMAIATAAALWIAQHTRAPTKHRWVAKWAHHLDVLKRPGSFVVAVGLSAAIRVAALVAIYAVQRSLGVDLPVKILPVVLAAVTFATLVTIAPGNLGVYEAATFAAYRLLGVPAGEAAALGLLQHACLLVPLVGTGYVRTVVRAISPSRLTAPTGPTTDQANSR